MSDQNQSNAQPETPAKPQQFTVEEGDTVAKYIGALSLGLMASARLCVIMSLNMKEAERGVVEYSIFPDDSPRPLANAKLVLSNIIKIADPVAKGAEDAGKVLEGLLTAAVTGQAVKVAI